MMSSPGLSSGNANPTHHFEDLWRQLRECHQNALKELEEKVSKLKKERYLDAQSLEVFHIRTQQLKDQNKTLQDAISRLEERLCAAECDGCARLEENLKNSQDQNIRLIAKLKNERDSFKEENRKLHAELQKLQMCRSEPQQASPPEPEEGFIPDSPVLPSSLPVVNKLKKRKHDAKVKHVRYAEMPLPKSNNSLFSVPDKEPVEATKNPGRLQVLVPNTCELDTSQVSNDAKPSVEEPIAETCGLELIDRPRMGTTAGQQRSSKPPLKYGLSLIPYHSSSASTRLHSPDSTTDKSPSLLPSVKRFSGDGSINKAKRKKEEREPQVQEEDKRGIHDGVDKEKEGKHAEPELIKRSSTSSSNRSFKKWLLDSVVSDVSKTHQVQSPENGTSSQTPIMSCISPAFKKPKVKGEANECGVGKKENLSVSHDQHKGKDAKRRIKVEPAWSIDPALALSMYDRELQGDEEEQEEDGHGDLLDSDRTWVSHSLLQRRGENAEDGRESGLGKKANDSLDMMFDTTAHGEYDSHLGRSQPCDAAAGDDDDDDGEEDHDQQDPHENTMSQINGHKARCPTFAHVAVVRKKDERRKLKGTTCKECEIYYAHLPEEDKQKKLAACSRHRFRYIPPCTPEHFWEVGFPSTQTCVERGYIKEEKNPQARTRRRQPFNALFSPKQNQQQS